MNDTPILTAILNLTRVVENLDRNLASALSGQIPPKQAPTLYIWLSDYLGTYRRKFQSPAVYAENLNRIEKKIKPNLPDKPLNDFATKELQDFVNRYEDTPNAQKQVSVLLGGAFQKAQDTGLITFNPFKPVELKPHKAEHYAALQPREQLKTLKALQGSKYRDLFLFCCCTGMRLGEALSIDVKRDVNFRRKVVTVPLPDTSKKKHKRGIPFLPDMLPAWPPRGKLFPFSAAAVQSFFKRLFKRLGIRAVFHSLRHTFISCCYSVGMPIKHIQTWAGHSSIDMTMDVYTHILDRKETPITGYLERLKKALKLR